MSAGERVAAAAQELVGARFRLHGRDPATGLDCVGVALLALERGAGRRVALPAYALRTATTTLPTMDDLTTCDGAAAGDVLLCRVGPGQLHVTVRTETGVVHADAALRRVVERPGAVPWPILSAWRIGEA